MKGVYKITNPSGSIYIGQSIDIQRRWANHKNVNYNDNCGILAKSFKKHGIENHVFEIIHELPYDCTAEVLNNYETFCIQQYKEAGIRLLNVKPTANNHNEETRKKISDAHKGKQKSKEHIENHRNAIIGKPSPMEGKTHTDEAKVKIKAARAKQTNVKGPTGHKPWNKGIKTGAIGNIKPKTEEEKLRISNSLKGKKLSPESIAKRTETRLKNGWNKRSRDL